MPIRKSNDTLFYLFGTIPVIWLALLLAQSLGGGLPELLRNLTSALEQPTNIIWTDKSLPTILICYSYRTYFNSDAIWYVGNMNLYYAENVRLLIVLAYTVVKLPFSLRMIKAAFYSIDSELEDAARNMGAGGLRTFLQVKLPIILPSVLAVFALNFNALFTEYDMSATFASSYGTSYAMVIQSMCAEEGLYGYNVNASGRRCASTVFIMLVSGLILYLVYGVGARDLGERLEARDRRRKRMDRIKAVFHKKQPAEAASPQ